MINRILIIGSAIPSLDGFNVNEYSAIDSVWMSIQSNSTTNWVTSLDFGNYYDQTDEFVADTEVYGALSHSENLFCIFKLFLNNGTLDIFKWFNYTLGADKTSVHYSVVSNIKMPSLLIVIDDRDKKKYKVKFK